MVLSRKLLLTLIFLAMAFVVMASATPSLEEAFQKRQLLPLAGNQKRDDEPAPARSSCVKTEPCTTTTPTLPTHTCNEGSPDLENTVTATDDDDSQPTVVGDSKSPQKSVVVVSGGNPSRADDMTSDSVGYYQRNSALIISTLILASMISMMAL
ncbi:2840_t:CDS:2 [Cetraspora pellucida]|uniref:2840_t:CDS:1 n=1 Tax=Cetraspora pellucida TaxID=1433469 RepID=A0A9N8YV11_9GLOM|nr:2840_t:CDS:2 [Cetraspora pellucida]